MVMHEIPPGESPWQTIVEPNKVEAVVDGGTDGVMAGGKDVGA